jgi:hypothetical protein
LARLGPDTVLISFRGALGEERLLGIIEHFRKGRRETAGRIFVSGENARELLASCRHERTYKIEGDQTPLDAAKGPDDRGGFFSFLIYGPGGLVSIQPFHALGRGHAIVERRP